MYKNQAFEVVEEKLIIDQLVKLHAKHKTIDRIYLTNGDAFALSYGRLKDIIGLIRSYYPSVQTIAMFASISNIKNKTNEELDSLRHLGVNEITIGFESGWDDVLRRMNKGHMSGEAVKECGRLTLAGMDYHFSIVAGIAGNMLGFENACITAEVLNRTSPRRIDLAGLTVYPNSDLAGFIKTGEFIESREFEMVQEIIELVRRLKINTYIDGTHCTVPIRFAGRLPEDRDRMISELEESLVSFNERRLRRRREKYMKLRK